MFAREVEHEASQDERIEALDGRIAEAEGAERQELRARRATLWVDVLAQKRREFADRFDAVHSIERAVRVRSVSSIVAPPSLRAFLIDAVERGIRRAERSGAVSANPTPANGDLAHAARR